MPNFCCQKPVFTVTSNKKKDSVEEEEEVEEEKCKGGPAQKVIKEKLKEGVEKAQRCNCLRCCSQCKLYALELASLL